MGKKTKFFLRILPIIIGFILYSAREIGFFGLGVSCGGGGSFVDPIIGLFGLFLLPLIIVFYRKSYENYTEQNKIWIFYVIFIFLSFILLLEWQACGLGYGAIFFMPLSGIIISILHIVFLIKAIKNNPKSSYSLSLYLLTLFIIGLITMVFTDNIGYIQIFFERIFFYRELNNLLFS